MNRSWSPAIALILLLAGGVAPGLALPIVGAAGDQDPRFLGLEPEVVAETGEEPWDVRFVQRE